jgi:hypothetical protein
MILIMSKFVQEKSLTICSGLDMVNINFFNIVCKDAETSQVKQSTARIRKPFKELRNRFPACLAGMTILFDVAARQDT